MTRRFPLYLLFFLFFCSCQKEKNTGTRYEKLFEQNFLNRDFIITLAKDHETDLTAAYKDYRFILLKTDYYHGPLKAIKNGEVFNGTWSTNDDYGKLIIELPGEPQEFQFLSRSWRFLSKGIPVLKFAPWGAGDDIVLHMKRL